MEFKMTEMELKAIAQSDYAGCTMKMLDKWFDICTDIIQDSDASSTDIIKAAKDRAVVELCINLFLEVAKVKPDFTGRTACELIEKDLGLSINKLQKSTQGGLLAQDILEKSKQATNKFANWLAKKTN